MSEHDRFYELLRVKTESLLPHDTHNAMDLVCISFWQDRDCGVVLHSICQVQDPECVMSIKLTRQLPSCFPYRDISALHKCNHHYTTLDTWTRNPLFPRLIANPIFTHNGFRTLPRYFTRNNTRSLPTTHEPTSHILSSLDLSPKRTNIQSMGCNSFFF